MSYEYDAENKLVRVVTNGTTVNYKYDGLGRRVEKEVNDGATTKVTRFVYDAEDILLELDGSNNIVARYTHGPGIDEPLILEKAGASFFYHADGLGSITEITNQTGAVAHAYTYSSFGKIESQLDPNFIQPYTFTAREFDPETGLYHYRKRTLDPNTGRFSQQDPVGGFKSAPQTLNKYPYVTNNPVTYVDPLGLSSRLACIGSCVGNCILGNLPIKGLAGCLAATATFCAARCALLGPGFGVCFATCATAYGGPCVLAAVVYLPFLAVECLDECAPLRGGGPCDERCGENL
jgi:RHS repeat-associated protein